MGFGNHGSEAESPPARWLSFIHISIFSRLGLAYVDEATNGLHLGSDPRMRSIQNRAQWFLFQLSVRSCISFDSASSIASFFIALTYLELSLLTQHGLGSL